MTLTEEPQATCSRWKSLERSDPIRSTRSLETLSWALTPIPVPADGAGDSRCGRDARAAGLGAELGDGTPGRRSAGEPGRDSRPLLCASAAARRCRSPAVRFPLNVRISLKLRTLTHLLCLHGRCYFNGRNFRFQLS